MKLLTVVVGFAVVFGGAGAAAAPSATEPAWVLSEARLPATAGVSFGVASGAAAPLWKEGLVASAAASPSPLPTASPTTSPTASPAAETMWSSAAAPPTATTVPATAPSSTVAGDEPAPGAFALLAFVMLGMALLARMRRQEA